jgi:hypothetical protein
MQGHCRTYYEHWQAVKHHYLHHVRVHDLGNGQREVLVTRSDRWHRRPEHVGLRSLKPQEEIDADNADRAARRAKSEVRRRCKAMALDSMLTLTYRENQTDEALCKAHLIEFVRRIRRVIPDFFYVAAFERQERGAWHVHMAVRRVQSHFMQSGIRVKSFDLVRSIWRSVVGDLGGNIDLKRRKAGARKTVAQLAAYLSKYMLKAFSDGEAYSKRWTSSRFKMSEPVRRLVLDKDLVQILHELIAEHAPEGTVIRCCFVDNARGVFMTVEPVSSRCSQEF